MNSLDGFAREIAAAGAALGPMTLATGLILLVAYGLDRLLERRVSAGVRMWLYLPVALRLALPADFSTGLGLLGVLLGGRSGGAEVTLGAPVIGVSSGAASSGPSALWLVALAAYLLVTLALLHRWWRTSRTLRRDLGTARPISIAEAVSSPAGLELAARVCEHPTLGPAVIGLLRPRIVLPQRLLAAGDPQAVELVLRHEAAHVRRGDHVLAALLRVGCVLLWPLLPVWLASWRLRILMECACDERATRGEKPPVVRRYGELLLAMAEGHRGPGRPAQPIPAFGSLVAGRLRALGQRRRWPLLLQALPVLAGGAIALACSGTAEETARPEPRSEDSEPGTAVVRGSLDKEIIRQGIVDNLDAVRACYEPALVRRPTLTGKVTVQFTIGPQGDVVASMLERSTLGDPRVESCIVKEARRWKFPAPEGGGIVVVSYPFLLTSSGADRSAPAEEGGGAFRGKSPKRLYGLRAPSASDVAALDASLASLRDKAAAGPTEREVVHAIGALELAPVKSCYESTLKRDPTLAGQLEISATVDTRGKISEVRFTGPVDSQFSSCLYKAFVGRQLSVRPAAPMQVTFPFIMHGR